MAAHDPILSPLLITPAVQRIPVDELPAHLATLEAELDGGRRIELVRGDTVIAELHPPQPAPRRALPPSERPDFAARLKAIYGDKVYEDSTPLIREDRDAR